MIIDDLANRKHVCDVLLDQNFYLNASYRYDSLVPENCLKLLGSHYALIRPEFIQIKEARKQLGKFESHAIKNILLYMGGADPQNVTTRILQTLVKSPSVTQYEIN